MTVTRKQIRRHVAPYFGAFGVITSNASSTTTSLATDGAPWKSSLAQDDLLSDVWLYWAATATASDRIRRVTATGYSPSAGTLTPDLAWGSAPGNGVEIEFFGLIPPYDDGSGTQDLHFLINQALKRCLLVDEITFSPADSQARQHSLAAAASWLDDPQYVYRAGILASGDTRANTDPYSTHAVHGQAVKRGNTVYLEGFSGQPTDTVYVEVAVPAYYRCAAAATPTTFTQAGLTAEADVAIPDLDWIAAAVQVEAWTRIAHLLSTDAREAKQARAEAAATFSLLTDIWFQEPERSFTVPPLTIFGPIGGQRRGDTVYDHNRMY